MKFTKSIILRASLAAALAFAPTAFAKEWKTVAIGMDEAFAPWHSTDSSGKMVGFDVDLAMDLCHRAGFECKIVTQDWDGLIPGLKAGKFDVIIAGMAITDERKKEIDFSKPYARTPIAFVAAKDSPVANALGPGKVVAIEKDPAAGDAAIKALQVTIKGRTIGVPSSSIELKFANEHLKDVATVKEYKNTEESFLDDLKSGQIDLAFDSAPAIAVVLDKPDSKNLEIVGPEFVWSHGGAGIGLRKSDADLTAAFNQALDAAFADVKKYSIKWFKVNTTP
jgi:octopine/nopaline transport system substrate-binding protein